MLVAIIVSFVLLSIACTLVRVRRERSEEVLPATDTLVPVRRVNTP